MAQGWGFRVQGLELGLKVSWGKEWKVNVPTFS